MPFHVVDVLIVFLLYFCSYLFIWLGFLVSCLIVEEPVEVR